MNKLLFTSLIIITFYKVQAQQFATNNFSDSVHSHISIQSFFGINSTGLSNKILNDVYSGKVIDSDSKIKAINSLLNSNNAGLEFSTNVFYQKQLIDKKLDFYKIGFRNRQFASINFSRDLLGIIALGNGPYEDQKAELKLNYKSFNYQSIYYGIGKKINNNISIEAQLSAIIGSNYQELNLNNSNLYTAPYGEYIESYINFDYHQSDKKSTGIGSSISALINYDLSEKSNLKLGVHDFGVISWNKVNTISLDSNFYFDGFEIPNILQPTSFSTDNLSPDSLQSFVNLDEKNSSKTGLLPSYIFLNYTHIMNDKSSIEFGVQSINLNTKNLLFYSKYNYQFKSGLNLNPIISYGGFGGLNLGLDINKSISEKLKIGIESRYIDALALFNYKSGLGTSINLSYKL